MLNQGCRRSTLLCLLLWNCIAPCGAAQPLHVMTYNLWVGGEAGQQPLAQSVQVILAADAEIVGLQETGSEERGGQRNDNGQAIARTLGWYYFDQGEGRGILSRYPILAHSPQAWGVRVLLPSGETVYHFNAHLAHAPYQPYQLLNIPYADAPFLHTAEQAVDAARQARATQIAALLADLKQFADAESLCVVTGDFNEPSLHDWTDQVAAAKRCPCVVRWPTTQAVVDAGFIDAYRAVHANPLEFPGYTWTTQTREDDPADHHDRIDFVFLRSGASGRAVRAARVVGEREERSDVVVTPYPSDHRAVVVTLAP